MIITGDSMQNANVMIIDHLNCYSLACIKWRITVKDSKNQILYLKAENNVLNLVILLTLGMITLIYAFMLHEEQIH